MGDKNLKQRKEIEEKYKWQNEILSSMGGEW